MRGPREVLAGAGIVMPDDVKVLEREERAVVLLDEERVAYVATDIEGVERLSVERDILEAVGSQLSFAVPLVLDVDPEGRFDVRTRIRTMDPWIVFEQALKDDDFACDLGRTCGRMLAELHQIILPREVAERLPTTRRWPLSSDLILDNVPRVVDDRGLHARIREALEAFDDSPPSDADVFTHGDFGFHNMGFDDDYTVVGLFDFDEAGFGDRHWDFRNLVFDPMQPKMLAGASEQYVRASGSSIDRDSIIRFSAVNAFSHLAYRLGHPAEEKWCGRTLQEDLDWCNMRLSDLAL